MWYNTISLIIPIPFLKGTAAMTQWVKTWWAGILRDANSDPMGMACIAASLICLAAGLGAAAFH